MLFAILSEPLPTRPSEAAENRRRYWQWLAPLRSNGTVRDIYARTGRGAIAIVNVDTNEALHRILNEWAEIIPAHFQIFPLIDTQAAQSYLQSASVIATPAKSGGKQSRPD